MSETTPNPEFREPLRLYVWAITEQYTDTDPRHPHKTEQGEIFMLAKSMEELLEALVKNKATGRKIISINCVGPLAETYYDLYQAEPVEVARALRRDSQRLKALHGDPNAEGSISWWAAECAAKSVKILDLESVLGWLESHAMAQHSTYVSIADLGNHYNGFPGSLRSAVLACIEDDKKRGT